MNNIKRIASELNLIVIIVQIILIIVLFDKLPNYVWILDSCCTILCIVIFLNNFKYIKHFNKNFCNLKKTSLKKYNNNLQKVDDDLRAFRHDFNNIMQAIGGYIKLNDFEGLKVYYKDLAKEYGLLKNLVSVNPMRINNNKLYNIIIKKRELAKKKSISFEFVSFVDFKFISDMNIEEIMEKLLDYAIEVAEKTLRKEVIVDCLYDEIKNEVVIIVVSTLQNMQDSSVFENINYNKKYEGIKKLINQSEKLTLYVIYGEDILVQELNINIAKKSIEQKERIIAKNDYKKMGRQYKKRLQKIEK